jgi:hypothetical protein
MDKVLTMFIYTWAGLVLLANVIGIAGMMVGAPSFWAGIARFQEVYSPFNVWTHGLNLVLLSPAIGAYVWRGKRRERALTK